MMMMMTAAWVIRTFTHVNICREKIEQIVLGCFKIFVQISTFRGTDLLYPSKQLTPKHEFQAKVLLVSKILSLPSSVTTRFAFLPYKEKIPG